jgi:translation initiation factor 2B subunit (eIF-2B alpha/beta/delta family)
MNSVELLKFCAKDKTRGSLDIAIDIIEASSSIAKNLKPQKLITLLKKIMKNQPSMALVINICSKIIHLIEDNELDDIILLKKNLLDTSQKVCSNATKYLNNKSICTISYSREVFCSIVNSDCKEVYIGVAHPKKEGETFALDLKDSGKKVVLFEDNNYLFGARMCDVFVSGADAVFDDAFVNKSQTFSLCLFANYFKKPFYVVANTYKYLSTDLRKYYKILQMPKKEVTKKDLDTYNVYFEEIPLELVTLIRG